jgi:hypothetical protein
MKRPLNFFHGALCLARSANRREKFAELRG